jgi:hypothetical protein
VEANNQGLDYLRECGGEGDKECGGGPEEGTEHDDAELVVARCQVRRERVAGGQHDGAGKRDGAQRGGRRPQRVADLSVHHRQQRRIGALH